MDKNILKKELIKKIEKAGLKNVPVRISQKASDLGISNDAALVLLAKEYNIGANKFQKKLETNSQSDIRSSLLSLQNAKTYSKKTHIAHKVAPKPSNKSILKAAIDLLIKDIELKDRCSDLILANKNFDRAVNQATLILEDRVRNKIDPTSTLVGVNLINSFIKSELSKTRIKLSMVDDIQEGYANIFRGMFGPFRNTTHHRIVKVDQDEALIICSFIDYLLRAIDKSTIV